MGGPGGSAPPGDLAAFGAALDRLARRWLWWLLLAHFGITGVEVSGHEVGIYPFAWILTPLLLGALIDVRREMPEPAAGLLTATLAVATVAAVVDFAGMFGGHAGPGGVSDRVVWPLTSLGLGLFGAGMVRWAESVPAIDPGTRADLVRAWRRSVRWAGASLAFGLGTVLGLGVLAVSDDRSFTATWSAHDVGSWGWPVVVGAVVLALGPLFSAAASTDRTRRALAPPSVVRPRRRLAGGG